jgi:pimeloyl-ACP methyl ester carboxylesterase
VDLGDLGDRHRQHGARSIQAGVLKCLRRALAALAVGALAACASVPPSGDFLAGTVGADRQGDRLVIVEPAEAIVVIWHNGWLRSDSYHLCDPRDDAARAGPPPVVKALAGRRDRRVVLYVHCTHYALDWSSVPDWWREADTVAAQFEKLVGDFTMAGVPSERIVLAGQSLGGWMALVVAARVRIRLGGVIAFAPGFAPEHVRRNQVWWAEMATASRDLAATLNVPSLVYAYEDDPWDLPEHLKFLAGIAGVEFVVIRRGDLACPVSDVHLSAYAPCFADRERRRIETFVDRAAAQRLSTSGPKSQ